MNKSCFEKNPAITMDLHDLKYWQLSLLQIDNTRLINKTKAIINSQESGLITRSVKAYREKYLNELILNRGDILVELDSQADLIEDEILYRDIQKYLAK